MRDLYYLKQEYQNPPWKHNNPAMTITCFIAYYLGFYKYKIRAWLKFMVLSAIAISIVYAILYLFNISVFVHRADELLFMIEP